MLNVRFTPARLPVVIKQSISEGDNAIQVKYQTRRLPSTRRTAVFLFCHGGVKLEMRPLLGSPWSTFNTQISRRVSNVRSESRDHF